MPAKLTSNGGNPSSHKEVCFTFPPVLSLLRADVSTGINQRRQGWGNGGPISIADIGLALKVEESHAKIRT
jgi:hypothetical protein